LKERVELIMPGELGILEISRVMPPMSRAFPKISNRLKRAPLLKGRFFFFPHPLQFSLIMGKKKNEKNDEGF
jgi:hypothetical protein